MTELLAAIFAATAAIVAFAAAVAAIRCYVKVADKESRYSIHWYLDRLWVDADSRRIDLANLQDSVDFMIHNREIDRDSRYPAPTSALIQEQFEERLKQAGWDFEANAEYTARLMWFVDTKELIARRHGCRFYAYLQASPYELPSSNHLGGCHIFSDGRASVDESIRRWKEHGFDNRKRFELLDKYLIKFIGEVENPLKNPDPVFPLHPWPSGIRLFENQQESSHDEF